MKRRIIAVVTGLALFALVAGASGIVVDALGLEVISPAHACETSTSGGGC
jgi:hypothetical protein